MKVDKFVRRRITLGLLVVPLVMWLTVRLVPAIVPDPPAYSCAVYSVEVGRGDTLYALAHKHCSGDIDEVIGLLVRMYGTRLETWHTIHLPIASEG